MRRSVTLVLGVLLFVCSLAAQEEVPPSISPARGPASGGTSVTIKGNFGFPSYSAYFGTVPAPLTTKLDDHTLVAETPPHAPGVVDVILFEYDIFVSAGVTFEFTEADDSGLEYLLLPLFTPPARGAFGSEFWTELRGTNTGVQRGFTIAGLIKECQITTPMFCNLGEPVTLGPGEDLPYIERSGTPGRFIGVPREDDEHFSAHLRVYDASRSLDNFGTAIPIVRYSEFRHQPFALTGVPLHPRFRNTLRLYAAEETRVRVKIGEQTHVLTLRGNSEPYEPAYAMFSGFPDGSGYVSVIVEPEGPASVWGFISVTNNESQHITTITPR